MYVYADLSLSLYVYIYIYIYMYIYIYIYIYTYIYIYIYTSGRPEAPQRPQIIAIINSHITITIIIIFTLYYYH